MIHGYSLSELFTAIESLSLFKKGHRLYLLRVAIEKMIERLERTESYEAYDWAIDDCALFEPSHAEMAELF